jgi:hypothetical protein
MAALTYQSQHMATTAANSSQQMNQYMQTLATNKIYSIKISIK